MAANLLSGLVQGYAEAKAKKDDKNLNEELKKLQVKIFKQQLEDRDKEREALSQFEAMLGGQPPASTGGEPIGPPEQPRSLLSILSDPQGSVAAMRAGLIKGSDILGLEKQRQGFEQTKSLLGSIQGGGATGGMELQGVKLGPEGQLMPDFGLPQVTTQTVDTPDGPRIKTFENRTGKEVADLGPAKADRMSPQEAGSVANISLGMSALDRLKAGIINQDGSINRTNVNMMSTDLPFMGEGVPFTKGRGLRSDFKTAADAVIRARTGATMTEEEAKGLMSELMPGKLDNDATILQKINKLQAFLNGQVDVVTLPPRIADAYKKSKGNKVIKFEDLP